MPPLHRLLLHHPIRIPLTLSAVKLHASLQAGYTVVFAMAAFWFILGTVFVRQVRGVR